MKKQNLFLALLFFLLSFGNSLYGQKENKHSLGLLFGYSTIPGISYKYMPTEDFIMQTDLATKILLTGNFFHSKAKYIVLPLIEISENLFYQHLFAEKGFVTFHYMIGGGISCGLQPFQPMIWKIGSNAFAGVEFRFSSSPVSLQLDFRPGYVVLFWSEKTQNEINELWNILTPGLSKSPQSCFDWSLNFIIRFRL